jgi:hypothetical protein
MLHIPGGNDAAGHEVAKTQAQLDYLAWLRKRVAFFPKNLPEHIILEALEPGKGHADAKPKEAKAALKTLVSDGVDVDLNGDDIITLAKVKIATLPIANHDLTVIRDRLKSWLHG